MTRASTPLALAAAFGLAVASLARPAPAAAQDGSAGKVGPREVVTPFRPQEPAIPASMQEIFRRLATYWEDGDARGIAGLAHDGRVQVVVQRRGVGERLAASQLQYLLEDLFEGSREVVLRFPAYAAYDPASGTGYAVGERVYRDGPGAETRVDRVFAAARTERGRWVLTELRLTSE